MRLVTLCSSWQQASAVTLLFGGCSNGCYGAEHDVTAQDCSASKLTVDVKCLWRLELVLVVFPIDSSCLQGTNAHTIFASDAGDQVTKAVTSPQWHHRRFWYGPVPHPLLHSAMRGSGHSTIRMQAQLDRCALNGLPHMVTRDALTQMTFCSPI